MSSFSICKVCSGSVFLCQILAPVWLASLPNQMLGKVATFLMRLAWLVTSFMLSICGQRRGTTCGKQKENQTSSHRNSPGETMTFLLLNLPPAFLHTWSEPFTMSYHLGICIQNIHPVWKKICIAQRRAPRQYSSDMEISPLPSGPFCPGSLIWRSKIQSLFLGKFFHVMSPNYPRDNFQCEWDHRSSKPTFF